LGALEEQLGQPELLVGTTSLDVEDPLVVRIDDPELPPVFAVGPDLDAEVFVRRVVLEKDLRDLERDFLAGPTLARRTREQERDGGEEQRRLRRRDHHGQPSCRSRSTGGASSDAPSGSG